MPNRFYRITSRIPLEPPKLIIGDIHVQPGFTTLYSELMTSLKEANAELRARKKRHRMGKHSLDIIDVDPGVEVRTRKGIVVTKAIVCRREIRN